MRKRLGCIDRTKCRKDKVAKKVSTKLTNSTGKQYLPINAFVARKVAQTTFGAFSYHRAQYIDKIVKKDKNYVSSLSEVNIKK